MTIATFATLLVALVAGLFSVLGLVIAKEQKVSDLRQAWIDALRHDATQVTATIERWPTATKLEEPEVLLAYRASVTAVRLRLNKSEQPSQAVLAVLRAMDALIAAGDRQQPPIAQQSEAFVSAMQTVLKTEWDRVKEGEPGYRKVRKAVVWGTTAAAVVIVLLGYTSAVVWTAGKFQCAACVPAAAKPPAPAPLHRRRCPRPAPSCVYPHLI